MSSRLFKFFLECADCAHYSPFSTEKEILEAVSLARLNALHSRGGDTQGVAILFKREERMATRQREELRQFLSDAAEDHPDG